MSKNELKYKLMNHSSIQDTLNGIKNYNCKMIWIVQSIYIYSINAVVSLDSEKK